MAEELLVRKLLCKFVLCAWLRVSFLALLHTQNALIIELSITSVVYPRDDTFRSDEFYFSSFERLHKVDSQIDLHCYFDDTNKICTRALLIYKVNIDILIFKTICLYMCREYYIGAIFKYFIIYPCLGYMK